MRPLDVGDHPTTAGEDVGLLDSLAFFFVIAAVSLPTAIASCSLAGEKVERTLEPLPSTPVPDAEILVGKVLDALLPPIAALCASFALFIRMCPRNPWLQPWAGEGMS